MLNINVLLHVCVGTSLHAYMQYSLVFTANDLYHSGVEMRAGKDRQCQNQHHNVIAYTTVTHAVACTCESSDNKQLHVLQSHIHLNVV